MRKLVVQVFLIRGDLNLAEVLVERDQRGVKGVVGLLFADVVPGGVYVWHAVVIKRVRVQTD